MISRIESLRCRLAGGFKFAVSRNGNTFILTSKTAVSNDLEHRRDNSSSGDAGVEEAVSTGCVVLSSFHAGHLSTSYCPEPSRATAGHGAGSAREPTFVLPETRYLTQGEKTATMRSTKLACMFRRAVKIVTAVVFPFHLD